MIEGRGQKLQLRKLDRKISEKSLNFMGPNAVEGGIDGQWPRSWSLPGISEESISCLERRSRPCSLRVASAICNLVGALPCRPCLPVGLLVKQWETVSLVIPTGWN